MDGEGSKSRDEIRIAKWIVGGVIPSILTSWCPYCSISPLLSLILPLGRTSYAMEEERTEEGWCTVDESGWSRVMCRGGEASCCGTTAGDVASVGEIQPCGGRR